MLEETKPINEFIQDVTRLSSQEDLWCVFNNALEGYGFNRWCYLSYKRLSQGEGLDQIKGVEPIVKFGGEITIHDMTMDLPSEIRNRLVRILHHIETPCYFEDIPTRLVLSNEAMMEIRGLSSLGQDETLLIVPSFSSGLNAGYFLIVLNKEATRLLPEELTILAMQCQLTHNHYRALKANCQKYEIVLSPREKKILEYIAEGYSNFEIGKALELSPHIINVYVKVILGKTNSHSRTTAVLNAIALGLIK